MDMYKTTHMHMHMQTSMTFLLLLTASLTNGAGVYQKDMVLRRVNGLRAAHGATAVVFDEVIGGVASSWADVLTKSGAFEHSDSRYGENLAWLSSATKKDGDDCTDSVFRAIDLWYSEVRNYNFDKPGYSATTGHFTQLVWKGSKRIGLGVGVGGGKIVVVMNFDPPGNFLNAFDENVWIFSPIIRSPPNPPILSSPPSVPNALPSPSPPILSSPPMPNALLSSPMPKALLSSPMPNALPSQPIPPPNPRAEPSYKMPNALPSPIPSAPHPSMPDTKPMPLPMPLPMPVPMSSMASMIQLNVVAAVAASVFLSMFMVLA